jgi:hypothetical protein
MDLFDDEVLPILGLASYLLLDGARARAHFQMMLNHLSGDSGKIRWLQANT